MHLRTCLHAYMLLLADGREEGGWLGWLGWAGWVTAEAGLAGLAGLG